jgi:hypothetical protein
MHEATSWCWAKLEGGDAVQDAHTLSEVLIFLAHVPERDRAAERAARLSENLGQVRLLHLDPEASALEWRGVATLRALLTLRSYGRLSDD